MQGITDQGANRLTKNYNTGEGRKAEITGDTARSHAGKDKIAYSLVDSDSLRGADWQEF